MRAVLTTLIAILALAGPAQAGDLAQTRAALAKQMRSAGAYSGALAVDLDTGATIYARRAGTDRIPASVEKLYTTSAALLRFGPDGTLPTTLHSRVAPDGEGVLNGDVWLRGSGDPTLTFEAFKDIAAQLVETGIVAIHGNIRPDESAFDTLRGPPSEGYRASRWVGPLSALGYYHGRYSARRVGFYLRRALRRAGIEVRGKVRRGTTPDEPLTLATAVSSPMSSIIRTTNVPSDNWYAEQLLKAIGADSGVTGTTASGARAAVRTLDDEFGIRPRMVDGSGLSASNRTSPREVVKLLRGMADEPAFERSLALAGRTGTVAERMRRTAARGRCRVKTGTIYGVSNLAGYCTSRRGARTAFAFLMNRVNPSGARVLQDRMAAALARYAPSS